MRYERRTREARQLRHEKVMASPLYSVLEKVMKGELTPDAANQQLRSQAR